MSNLKPVEKSLRLSLCLPLERLSGEIKLFIHLFNEHLLGYLCASLALSSLETAVSKRDKALVLVALYSIREKISRKNNTKKEL